MDSIWYKNFDTKFKVSASGESISCFVNYNASYA